MRLFEASEFLWCQNMMCHFPRIFMTDSIINISTIIITAKLKAISNNNGFCCNATAKKATIFSLEADGSGVSNETN